MLIKPQYFTDQMAVTVTLWLYNYYDLYHQLPTKESLNQLAAETPPFNNSNKPELLNQALIWIYQIYQVAVPDKEFILDKVKDFCVVQEYTLAILESAAKIREGKPREIPAIVEAAQHRLLTTQGDFGVFGIGMSAEERFRTLFLTPMRDCILTPWASVNQACQGIAKKELFVVLAPTGVGKTWLLSCITAEAVKQGKFVILYTLELSKELLTMRTYSLLAHRQQRDIQTDPASLEPTIQPIRERKGEFLVKHYTSGTATIGDLRDHITRTATATQRMPDMIVIDYIDLLRTEGAEKYSRDEEDGIVRHKLATLYKKARGIGEDFNAAIVSASQSGRETHGNEKLRISNFAESHQKAQIADIAWGLSQTEEEEQMHRGKLVCLKNRNDIGGQQVGLNLDYINGIISEEGSVIGGGQPEEGGDFLSMMQGND